MLSSKAPCSVGARSMAGRAGVMPVPMVLAPSAAPAAARVASHGSASTSAPSVPPVRRSIVAAAATSTAAANTVAAAANFKGAPMKVIIAGAGIGGLLLAVALLKQGFEVKVFERDLTAIRGEGKYRGPIQIQSNALAALEAIDEEVADEVLREGCTTGDRVNGLCDGLTGEWYVKFDTFHVAVNNGLPVTRVISRVLLQEILARGVERYGGPDVVRNGCTVSSYEERTNPTTGKQEVVVRLESGEEVTGDLLVGADGIWSRIRKQLVGETKANYSGYTCYTGISDFTPADIDIVGYRVFLGNGQYFVSSDVGNGKMQWYGFHKEAPGGTDAEGTRKARLLEIFGHWNDNVVDLIKATPEEDVLRRDIYDRPPIFQWSEGRVALLGDSAHAMQPNLGQGGCMAIEDAYELAVDLVKAVQEKEGEADKVDVPTVLKDYFSQRMMRAATIHGMAGMAAFMASTYKCYLGEGWSKWVESLRIPHPGRVVGRLVMLLTMPTVLGWVLGGNTEHVAPNRKSYCSLGDKPKAFEESRFAEFMTNDASIVHATSAHADWLLVAERNATAGSTSVSSGVTDVNSSAECKGIYLGPKAAVVGRSGGAGGAAVALAVDDMHAADQHAKVWHDATTNEYLLRDMDSASGTWLNGKRLPAGGQARLWPGDVVEFGRHPTHEVFKVKLQHVSLRSDELKGTHYTTMLVGKVRHSGQEQEQQQGQQQGSGSLVAA